MYLGYACVFYVLPQQYRLAASSHCMHVLAAHIVMSVSRLTPVCTCRSWYILAFQAPVLPELSMTSSDCEALDAGFRTGPSAMKTEGAITVDEVERKGSAWPACCALHTDKPVCTLDVTIILSCSTSHPVLCPDHVPKSVLKSAHAVW